VSDWLLYVDPSPRGAWALRLAALLPALGSARVVALATSEDVGAEPALLEHARAALARAALFEPRTRSGPAERAVVAEAQQVRYDMVIVPPAGRGAIRRMLQGSRVATVVRSVRAPVLVARRPPESLGRVLAAVSGGRLAVPVCEAALGLGGATGDVTFLHVAASVPLPFRPPAARKAATEPGAERDEAAAARAALASVRPGAELALRDGLVVDEVIAEFEAGAHDVLVVGARATGPAWGVEDVTERLLLACPGSVLIVPREAVRR
jgi:nucleotide-binding universal stress UspA family protein